MRGATSDEIALLQGAAFNVHVRAWIANADGTYKNLNALAVPGGGTIDFVSSVEIDQDIDQQVAQCMLRLKRDINNTSLSLSVSRTDSPLNRRDDGTTFATLVDIGRDFYVETAVVAPGATPVDADWKMMFVGITDSVTDDNASDATLEVIGRDAGAYIVDAWFPKADSRTYTSEPGGGLPIEGALQDVLNIGGFDGSTEAVLTLYTPVSPGYDITQFAWAIESVMDALVRLAQAIGGDVRYRWDDGTGLFRFTFTMPDRTKTTPDGVIGSDQYIRVDSLVFDRTDVRNSLTVNWGPATHRQTKLYQDASSISRYKVRPMVDDEASDSPIIDEASADRLGAVMLSDLAEPKATQQVTMLYDWRVELADLLRFSANGVHYDVDQDLAVSRVTHTLGGQGGTQHRSVLYVRGNPASAYLNWSARAAQNRAASLNPVAPPTAQASEVSENSTTLTLQLSGISGFTDGHLDYRVRQSNGSTMPDWPVWVTSGADLPQNLVVTRLPERTINLEFQTRDSAGTLSSIANAPVGPELQSIGVDGLPIRSVPYDDGGFSIRGTDPSTLHPSDVDSRGSAVNSHFRYLSDTAVGVVETATQSFAHPSYLDVLRRPIALRDGSSDVAAAVINTGQARANAAIDGGNVIVAAGVDFSRGYTGKHLDNIPDGTSYVRTVPNEKLGGARGYGGFTNATGALVSTAVDSRARAVNTGFQYGVDAASGVIETTSRAFVDPTVAGPSGGSWSAGSFVTSGTDAGYSFYDRDSAHGWLWYAYSGFARLFGTLANIDTATVAEATGAWSFAVGIAAPSYAIVGTVRLQDSGSGYTMLLSPNGTGTILLGSSAVDAAAYYQFNTHYFRSGAGGLYAALGAGQFSMSGNINVDGGYGFQIGTGTTLDKTGAYTRLVSPSGVGGLLLGDAADQQNYYSNDIHRFRNSSASQVFGTWSSIGVEINVGALTLNKQTNNSASIGFYNDSYTAYRSYMGHPSSPGPLGLTPSTGTYINSWALRSTVESAAGIGWVWETCVATGTTASRVMELESSSGNLKTIGMVVASDFVLA